jgi:hypothetical protein
MEPTTYYKMDMVIKNKGRVGTGLVILAEKELYTIELESKGRFHYFTFKTCSREISKENADRKLFKRHKVKINYRPNTIEQRGGCFVEVRAFDKDGKHSQGLIAFEDKYQTLPAMVICGGETGNYVGISACQEREGLTESITFENEVAIFVKRKGCELDKKKGKNFEFQIKKGPCYYTAMELKKPNRIHTFLTYGHEGNLIRE